MGGGVRKSLGGGGGGVGLSVCLSPFFFFFFFFFAFLSYISGVHHFWVRVLRM